MARRDERALAFTGRRGAVVGCLLGGALGDAWGGAYEGQSRPVVGGLPEELVVSDDTQLTVATCAAILEAGDVVPEKIATEFAAWFRARRLTGLGSSTLKALRDLAAGGHWALSGASGERAAGNGAAMRIAPLAFVLDPRAPDGTRAIRDVCSITHRNDAAYSGALAVALAVRFAAEGHDLETLPSKVVRLLPDTVVRDGIERLAAWDSQASLAELAMEHGSSGFVGESVPLAIQAARRGGRDGFLRTIRATIAAGGDTDTIASICGQIVGASIGEEGLPLDRVTRLSGVTDIGGRVRRFADLVVSG